MVRPYIARDMRVLARSGIFAALWDFRSMRGLWQDSPYATPVASDGDPVGYSPDLTGHGYDLIQTTDLARLTWKENLTNNQGAVFGGGAGATLYMTIANGGVPIRGSYGIWAGLNFSCSSTVNLLGSAASGLRVEFTSGNVYRAVNDGGPTLHVASGGVSNDLAAVITAGASGNGKAFVRRILAATGANTPDITGTFTADPAMTGNITHFFSNRTPALYFEDYCYFLGILKASPKFEIIRQLERIGCASLGF